MKGEWVAYKTWFDPARFFNKSEIPACCVGCRFRAGSSSNRIASFNSDLCVSAAKFTMNENVHLKPSALLFSRPVLVIVPSL